ncbi:MAG: hypothetical protein KDE55_06300 [Novosphingobium sp.]|nr:hypothetical protein [Novosphingobium sp.]
MTKEAKTPELTDADLDKVQGGYIKFDGLELKSKTPSKDVNVASKDTLKEQVEAGEKGAVLRDGNESI